jgi:proteasome alpha subunit
MGGQADAVSAHLREHFSHGMGLAEALDVGVRALSAVSPAMANGNGGSSLLPAEQLEVAVLDRRRPKRAFRRIVGAALRGALTGGDGAEEVPVGATAAHAPSTPAPGTPAGLGEPADPTAAGGAEGSGEGSGPQTGPGDGAGGGTDGGAEPVDDIGRDGRDDEELGGEG